MQNFEIRGIITLFTSNENLMLVDSVSNPCEADLSSDLSVPSAVSILLVMHTIRLKY